MRETGRETARVGLTRGRGEPLVTSKSVSFLYTGSPHSNFGSPWSGICLSGPPSSRHLSGPDAQQTVVEGRKEDEERWQARRSRQSPKPEAEKLAAAAVGNGKHFG